jgi:hypothetical protein
MAAPADSLPYDPGTLKAMLLAERTRAERLEQIIKEMQRHRFGRRAARRPWAAASLPARLRTRPGRGGRLTKNGSA